MASSIECHFSPSVFRRMRGERVEGTDRDSSIQESRDYGAIRPQQQRNCRMTVCQSGSCPPPLEDACASVFFLRRMLQTCIEASPISENYHNHVPSQRIVLRGQLSDGSFIFAPPRRVEYLTTSTKVKLRLKAASVVVPLASSVVVVGK
jgi:hypothetical protein